MATVTNQSFLRRPQAPRPQPLQRRRGTRTEVCPPGLPRDGGWMALYARLARWLMATSIHEAVSGFWALAADAEPRDVLLDAARQAFFDAIDDIETARSIKLAETIDRARSRQELWHLRAEVFALVSAHHDQAEAEQRLAGLNRFFPTRAPRSGFVNLENPR